MVVVKVVLRGGGGGGSGGGDGINYGSGGVTNAPKDPLIMSRMRSAVVATSSMEQRSPPHSKKVMRRFLFATTVIGPATSLRFWPVYA